MIVVVVDDDESYGLNPPVYIDTGGGQGYTESVYREGDLHPNHQACLPRQGESNPDTGTVFGLRAFTAHQSGSQVRGRTPEDPIVQDSLTYIGGLGEQAKTI